MRIGIDLGGTKIEGIALDAQGNELIRHRIQTPSGNYAATLSSVVELIAYLEKKVKKKASVGIGTPGALSPVTGLLRNSNSVCLNGRPLKTDLENMLGREIKIGNDANCFVLSEATDGAASGASVVFGVIIGTGTGAGIVVNGKLLTGPNVIAGEWGHNPLPWASVDEQPGLQCYCGKRGCIETFLSGPGLSADYFSHTGEQLSAVEIVRLSDTSSQAEACMRRYENRLARSLASIINVLDPDAIVLGGGMSNISSLYNNVTASWADYVFSDVVNTRLLAPLHGDSSGVRGAAWLWD